MLTSGSLAALQELLASWIAKDVSKHGHYFSARVPKMAVYGAFISAPLGHFLIKILQKVFSGRTSLKAKILQILASNLIVRFSSSSRLSLLFSPFNTSRFGPQNIYTMRKIRLPRLVAYGNRLRPFKIRSTSPAWP